MRIKIIGDNNCARATRHLLRLAGFAVTEFLPADVVTQAPHFGYAITIEKSLGAGLNISGAAPQSSGADGAAPGSFPLAPASLPLMPSVGAVLAAAEGSPSFEPELSTHGQTAVSGEAALMDGGVSSPAFWSEREDEKKSGSGAGGYERRQAEACPTGGSASGSIRFDSVDCELEAVVLRHVTQLAAAPVMVDRPGGVVRSERELRIILPVTGDARADEAAAVAVEFGVLRGLLDLTHKPSRGELSVGAGSGESWFGWGKRRGGKGGARKGDGMSGVAKNEFAMNGGAMNGDAKNAGKKKWWSLVVVVVSVVVFGVGVQASPRFVGGVDWISARGDKNFGDGLRTSTGYWRGDDFCRNQRRQAEACPTRVASPERGVRSVAAAPGIAPVAAAPAAAAGAQGQFATGLLVDPCLGGTKYFVSINQTGNSQLVAGTASKKIYVCSIHVVVAAATSVALVEGTGTVCATGTAGVSGFGGATAATGWNFMANGGIVLGNGGAAVGAEASSGDDLCLFNSGSGQVSGGVSYVVQ
jgi:hypothetical protein